MIAEIVSLVFVVPFIGLALMALDKHRASREPRIEDTPDWAGNTWIIRKDTMFRKHRWQR